MTIARVPALLKACRPRSLREVCLDVDAELAFHFDASAADLRAGGLDHDAARQRSLERFGELAEIRAEMISIGMRPWRRLGLVATLAAALTIAGSLTVATRFSAIARTERQGAALLGERLDSAKVMLAAAQPQSDLPMAQTVRFIRVRGAVANPSLWTIPRDRPVTVAQLIAKCGGLTLDATGRVFVVEDRAATPLTLDMNRSGVDPDGDLPLPRSCTLVVESADVGTGAVSLQQAASGGNAPDAPLNAPNGG